MANLNVKRNFTEGPLFGRMFLYSLPIMLTGLLQMCYNMADHIVVGKFSGDATALAAVGSTASLTNLVLGLLMGVSAGTAVVVAQFFGSKQYDRMSSAVHTSILFSILGGVAMMFLSFAIARPALVAMGTKADVIESAILYMIIVSCGFPAVSVMNFGAGILRSTGDSKTPLIIFSISGIINVLLNLFFVLVFKMSVDGVGWATVISQYFSAISILLILKLRHSEPYALSFKKLKIDPGMLFRILRLGVPAGIQGCLFSLSNTFFATAVNQFPTNTVTAKTIEGNVDNITYIMMNSYFHTSMTFAGQNYGAGKTSRIKRVIIYGLIQVVIVGLLISVTELIFAENLCMLFIDKTNPEYMTILQEAVHMSRVILTTYFICGIMEVLSGTARGLGYSISTMIIVLLSVCVLRIVWMTVLFNNVPAFHSIEGLLLNYPVTWGICAISLAVLLFIAMRKMSKARKLSR